MEVTYRGLITALHGILFGGFFLMAVFSIVLELYRLLHEQHAAVQTAHAHRFQKWTLILTCIFGWAAVLSGTFLVYPWYRAAPPPGVANLSLYPRTLLLSHPQTAQLHSVGMEWKEHISWLAPIAMTLVAFVLVRERRALEQSAHIRRLVLAFGLIALLGTGAAGLFGALLNKTAPVYGEAVLSTPAPTR